MTVEPLTLESMMDATKRLREVAPAKHRVLTEPVEVVAARIMAMAEATGTDPLAVARVYMRPEPELKVVVPAIDLATTSGGEES